MGFNSEKVGGGTRRIGCKLRSTDKGSNGNTSQCTHRATPGDFIFHRDNLCFVNHIIDLTQNADLARKSISDTPKNGQCELSSPQPASPAKPLPQQLRSNIQDQHRRDDADDLLRQDSHAHMAADLTADQHSGKQWPILANGCGGCRRAWLH